MRKKLHPTQRTFWAFEMAYEIEIAQTHEKE